MENKDRPYTHAASSYATLLAGCALSFLVSAPATLAQDFSNVIQAEVLPGWTQKDGSHIAGLHLTLAPGWKTYWRTPGDTGIPPVFSWAGSGNVNDVDVMFPAPTVFHDAGARTLGYKGEVVLPLKISPKRRGSAMKVNGQITVGICREVCMPHSMRVSVNLDTATTNPDPQIASALASIPFTGAEAGVASPQCQISLAPNGLKLTAKIRTSAKHAETVIESSDPNIWVSEPKTRRDGAYLIADAELVHLSGQTFALDRSGLTFTVLDSAQAIELKGCS